MVKMNNKRNKLSRPNNVPACVSEKTQEASEAGSELNLENLLQNSSVDVESLSEDYLAFNGGSRNERNKHFLNTIIKSAGLPDSVSFEDPKFKSYLSQKNMMVEQVPIINKRFRDQFGNLVYNLFIKNDGDFLWDDDFFETLILLVLQLAKGKFDSHRMTASVVGVKMISCSLFLRTKIKETGSTMSCRNKFDVLNKVELVWSKLFYIVVTVGLRDMASHVVDIVLNELLKWAAHYSSLLMTDKLHKYVVKSYMFKNPRNRNTGFLILLELSKNLKKERELALLFQDSKCELIACLEEGGNLTEIVIKILYNLSQKLTNMYLNIQEKELLLMAIYNPNQVVGYHAAKIFQLLYLSKCNTSIEKLQDLVAFHDESYNKNIEVLVDSFCWFFAAHFDVEEWICLMSSLDIVTSSVALFAAMVKRIVINRPPKNRTNHFSIIKKTESKAFAQQFTSEISGAWSRLIDLKSVRRNPHDLGKILGVLEFLNTERLSSQELFQFWFSIYEIFFNDERPEVLRICCFIMGHLEAKFEDCTVVLEKKTEMINTTCNEFIECINFPSILHDISGKAWAERMDSIAKYILFDDRELWRCLYCKAKEINSNSIRATRELALYLMRILFALTFRKHSKVYDLYSQVKQLQMNSDDCFVEVDKISDRYTSLEVDILPRIHELEVCYTRYLEVNVPSVLREEAFFFLTHLFTICGPHVVTGGSWLCLNFETEFFKKISSFAFESMIKCCQGEQMCCKVVEHFMKLIEEGMIKLSYVENLVCNISKSAKHAEIVLSSLQKYIMNFKDLGPDLLVFLIEHILMERLSLDSKDKVEQLKTQKFLEYFFIQFKASPQLLHKMHDLIFKKPQHEKKHFLLLKLISPFLSDSEKKYWISNQEGITEISRYYVSHLKSTSQ